MNHKQLPILLSLFFPYHSALAATYDLQPTSPLFEFSEEYDSTYLKKSSSQKQKEDYSEILKLINKKDLATAEKKITQLIKQNPKEAQYYNLRATVEFQQKKINRAIQSYQKAIEINSKNISSQLGISSVYLISGNLIQAKTYANRALSIDNNSVTGYIMLAEISYKEADWEETEKLLLIAKKKSLGIKKKEIEIAAKYARLYTAQQQPKKTLKVAQEIVNKYPNDSSALAFQARVQIHSNKLDLAIASLEKSIKQDQDNILNRLLLTKLLLNKPSQKQYAFKLLNKVDSLAPNDIQIQSQKAILLAQLGFFPEAISSTETVQKLAPNSALADALKGKIYLLENKKTLALSAFKRSYKTLANPETLNSIVAIMLAQGEQSELISLLNQEIKSNTENLSAHFNLGNLYLQQQKTNQAKKHYQYILTKEPNNALVLNNLAWIYYSQNNPNALVFAKKAYTISPNSPDIIDTYGTILLQKGHLTESIAMFKKASNLSPENFDIQYHLANAYTLNNQPKKATQILKTIVNEDTAFSERTAAINLLNKLNN